MPGVRRGTREGKNDGAGFTDVRKNGFAAGGGGVNSVRGGGKGTQMLNEPMEVLGNWEEGGEKTLGARERTRIRFPVKVPVFKLVG